MAEYRLTPAAERDLERIWTDTLMHRCVDVLTAAFAELEFGQLIVAEVLSGT